jgi:hypothetical protein
MKDIAGIAKRGSSQPLNNPGQPRRPGLPKPKRS